MSFKIGIDVGGTFTDLFPWSEEGAAETYKVLSTPEDPSVGVLDGLRVLAEAKGMSLEELAHQTHLIVHGTTVTTNAVLTRGGARTGLITTEGVRDALEMRRGIRERQYDNRYQNVVPLVPRRLRRPVHGRLDFRGEELEPLDLDEVRAAAEVFRDQGIAAVAVCLMHAYANPAHEEAAADLVRSVLPDAFLSVSSRVLPTIRFYNRVSTTVLNAYVGPVLRGYLESLTTRLAGVGFGGVLLVMQSNGGVALPEVILERPATTLLSGPAAGPRAAAAYAGVHGREDCILVDMGGTSFDASLVRDGAAAMNTEGEIDRLRIALPMLAIATIGAGGGSIGWIDEGGLLRMGPASARWESGSTSGGARGSSSVARGNVAPGACQKVPSQVRVRGRRRRKPMNPDPMQPTAQEPRQNLPPMSRTTRLSYGSESRTAQALLDEIREQISAGQILEARRLAAEAAASHPQDPEIRNAHRILNESRSYTRPATGRSTREEFEWLRDPPEEYRGKWVALIRSQVVGSADTLKELLASLPPDLEQTPLAVPL